MIWTIFKKNIEEDNPDEKGKKLIVSDDLVADILNNKKLNPIIRIIY